MSSNRKRQPAMSPEAHESRMIELAMKRAEQQLEDGTASAQVIVHFLKLGTSREKIEQEKIDLEKKLLEAKVDVIESTARSEELYSRAIEAMRSYSGGNSGSSSSSLSVRASHSACLACASATAFS